MAVPNTALFVIDIQHFLATDPATRIPHSERLKAAVQEILSTARSLNSVEGGKSCPIVFVQHEQVSEAGSLQRGTEPWELVFKPVDGASNEIIVSKTTGDVFESNPELVKQLNDQGITHLVAVGIQSECCVKATSKGALANGFQVSLLKGAHSTYNTGDATALEIEKEVEDLLEGLCAKIVPYGDAVKAWKAAGAVC